MQPYYLTLPFDTRKVWHKKELHRRKGVGIVEEVVARIILKDLEKCIKTLLMYFCQHIFTSRQ
jgi:hypothetical protein